MSTDVLNDRDTSVVTFAIFVDGQELPGNIVVSSIIVEREVNRIPSASLVFFDGSAVEQNFDISNQDLLIPGKVVEIQVGYHSENETIFKGIIVKHGIKAQSGIPSVISIECRDVAIRMTAARKSGFYADISDSELFEEIIPLYKGIDGPIKVEAEATGFKHPELCKYRCLDWDFIVSRAEVNGMIVIPQDGTITIQKPDLSQETALDLIYGTNLLSFELDMDAEHQLESVESHMWDQAGQEVLTTEGSPPNGELQGNLSAEDLAKTMLEEPVSLFSPSRIPEEELEAWASAKIMKSRLARIRGSVQVLGYSDIGPGQLVDMQGVGDRFNGKAFVSGVLHRIAKGTWVTDIQLGLNPECFAETFHIPEPQASGLLPPIEGLHIGKVLQLEGDEESGGFRCLVSLPFVEQASESSGEGIWARLSSTYAGNNRGLLFRPEIEDEVILGFINNDPRQAIILGSLHSNDIPAPVEASDDNFIKGIYTNSEMKMEFDDDAKSVLIQTPNENKILISEKDALIQISDENGNTVLLDSDGITLESPKNITLKATGDVDIEGMNINLVANAALTAEGTASAELSASGNTVIKGAMVQIN